MKTFLSLLCVLGFVSLNARTNTQVPPNLFIITIDGIRWQELFQGANEAILNDGSYVENTDIIRSLFWDTDTLARRKKLMPFFWNVVASKGQVYGNRVYGNNMDVTNNYKFSYPGYNEIFTGYPDSKFVPNTPVLNKNTNVLEFLNKQSHYHDSVVAFTSWNIFPFILNEGRSNIPINSGYEPIAEEDSQVVKINQVQQLFPQEDNTRLDALTFIGAKNYIQAHHPKVALISFGEADEFAHHGHYDKYLQSMNQVDRMIAELWYYIQTDEFYKDNTTIIITTDHGRGFKTNTWTDHLFFIKGSKEIWMAVLGPDILPLGEVKTEQTIYQKQLAATIAELLGFEFTSEHKTGKCLNLPLKGHNRFERQDLLVQSR
ncbi:phosphoglyceromutase [Taibaiella lutea]|uniref:Phosphoglyceromutase n=1 Tax=Taibaiella lutea TaxID=2608001 RepID=A0A5M6CHG6_9BACT|nr:alkaline phosphatase family protein [Taibaiella lutea]KAA5534604.1 phosphoglyceromutase [Taibaiella lutea]